MKFVFKNNAVDILKAGKYEKRRNGSYIRREVGGRFHVYIYSSRVIDMHYDLYVDGGKRHFTAPLYGRMKEEFQSLSLIDKEYAKTKKEKGFSFMAKTQARTTKKSMESSR